MISKIKSFFRKDKSIVVKRKAFENLTSPFYALVVADGHGTIPRYVNDFMKDVEDIDIVFYLGDLELMDFTTLNFYTKVANARKMGVVGNHDSEDDLVSRGIEDIHGKKVTFNGVDILGIRGSFKYKDVKGPMMTDEESEEFVEGLPGCDLLLTHDQSKHEEIGNEAHKGMSGISKYIKEHSPACHIHGHIHEYLEEQVEDTTSYSFYKLAYIKVTKNGVEVIKAYGKIDK